MRVERHADVNDGLSFNEIGKTFMEGAGRMEGSDDSDHPPHWTQWPWLWVLASTLIVSILGLIGLVNFSTQNVVEPGQKYVPPTMKDGEIVPAHFE